MSLLGIYLLLPSILTWNPHPKLLGLQTIYLALQCLQFLSLLMVQALPYNKCVSRCTDLLLILHPWRTLTNNSSGAFTASLTWETVNRAFKCPAESHQVISPARIRAVT